MSNGQIYSLGMTLTFTQGDSSGSNYGNSTSGGYISGIGSSDTGQPGSNSSGGNSSGGNSSGGNSSGGNSSGGNSSGGNSTGGVGTDEGALLRPCSVRAGSTIGEQRTFRPGSPRHRHNEHTTAVQVDNAVAADRGPEVGIHLPPPPVQC